MEKVSRFARGIWVFWDATVVNLQEVYVDDYIVNGVVRYKDFRPWLMFSIYAPPNPIFRLNLWSNLMYLGNIVVGWKKGGTGVHVSWIWAFSNVVSECGLHELGFSGLKFTWCNMRTGGARVHERLDRVPVINMVSFFPESQITHLPRSRFDHNTISPLIGQV